MLAHSSQDVHRVMGLPLTMSKDLNRFEPHANSGCGPHGCDLCRTRAGLMTTWVRRNLGHRRYVGAPTARGRLVKEVHNEVPDQSGASTSLARSTGGVPA